MFGSFRPAMTWLHTWFGLVLGYVLMAAFFFGALSVFDREIDRWSIPETRFAPQPMPSFDNLLAPVYRDLKPDPEDVEFVAPTIIGPMPDVDTLKLSSLYAYTTHRDPVLQIGGEYMLPNKPKDPTDEHPHVHGYTMVDPRNGAPISADRLPIGSEFFYPMHYSLHLYGWGGIGYWIVGLAALTMLAALVSGVVMHRKIFRELFTFRPNKQTQRRVLDLHNLTGVVALPFHFFFALTGLIIFAGIYLPVSETSLKPLHEVHEQVESTHTGLPLEASGQAAPSASMDAMVVEAQRRWAARGMAGEVGYLYADHLGDANGFVSIYRAGTDRVTLTGQGVHFRASTGEVIREDPPVSAVVGINDFLTGLHLQQFRHWLLRWLYFVGGIAGCICIATGFIFFVEKRKQQHAREGSNVSRWADALAVTAVTGMVVATLAILVANRLLPETLPGRDAWEERIFWFTWLGTLLHAAWRSAPVRQARLSPAWAEQCVAIAVLALVAPLLNWVTTGDNLWHTLRIGYWPVAGVDLVMLGTAVIAGLTARRLWSTRRAPAAAGSTEPVHA